MKGVLSVQQCFVVFVHGPEIELFAKFAVLAFQLLHSVTERGNLSLQNRVQLVQVLCNFCVALLSLALCDRSPQAMRGIIDAVAADPVWA